MLTHTLISSRKLVVALLSVATLAACSGSSPTSPTPPASTPAPTPVVTVTGLTLSGGACSSFGTCTVGGTQQLTVTAQLSNGTTQNVTSSSSWSSSNSGVATVSAGGLVTARATGASDVFAAYQGRSVGVTVNVPAPWSQSGSGNTVFDMPSYVSRVRIQGTPRSSCDNFAVRLRTAGTSSYDLAVNVILGTCSVADVRTYDGIHLTNGRNQVETVISAGVNWTFTEVRP